MQFRRVITYDPTIPIFAFQSGTSAHHYMSRSFVNAEATGICFGYLYVNKNYYTVIYRGNLRILALQSL